MMHSPQVADGYNSSTGMYDFSHTFDPIKEYLDTARFNCRQFRDSNSRHDKWI